MTHCRRLHRAVTQSECGLCWQSLRGDADCYAYRGAGVTLTVDASGAGWDECRAKHIEVTHGVDPPQR
jgi:hypothetical protein